MYSKTMRMTARDVAVSIFQSIMETEDRLADSPFKDEELDAALATLYRIAQSYEALGFQETTCCQREPVAA